MRIRTNLVDLSHLIGTLLLCYSQFKDKTYGESTTDRYCAGKMGLKRMCMMHAPSNAGRLDDVYEAAIASVLRSARTLQHWQRVLPAMRRLATSAKE